MAFHPALYLTYFLTFWNNMVFFLHIYDFLLVHVFWHSIWYIDVALYLACILAFYLAYIDVALYLACILAL